MRFYSARSSHAAIVLAVFALGCGAVEAAPQSPNTLQLKTEKVIVFKDGYCLVLKRGTAMSDGEGRIVCNDVPDAAVLGSFWATPKDGQMESMVAGWQETETVHSEDAQCTQVLEILQANIGKSCSLFVRDHALKGTIKSVLAKELRVPVANSSRNTVDANLLRHLRGSRPGADGTTSPLASLHTFSGSHFVLGADEGDILLNVNEIRELTVKDMNTTIERSLTKRTREKQLTFRFKQPHQRHELLIAYFRPGVRWIPSYRIDLTSRRFAGRAIEGDDDRPWKTARMSMQAEIINEAEDLLDAPIDIVVGVPNFRFRTVTSPFTLERVLQNALQQAAPNLMGQFRNDLSNSLYSQRSGEVRRAGAAAAEVGEVQLPGELTASGAQELFVYNLPPLKLKKGERAAVPIFTTDAPYRDVYTWDLHLKRKDIATAPSGSGVNSPLVLSKNEVWRQIELANLTQLPWTTGAAMIMQGNQPLAQELLTYTSVKDQCRVPVTVAIDVRGSHTERETDRKLKAMRLYGYDYAQIFQRSSLSVCNHKARDIKLEVTLSFGGRATKASDDGEIILMPHAAGDWEHYRGDPAANNSSQIRWTKLLKPGEVFEPTVDYFFYTRH